jgi:hypothetical protein
MVIGPVDRPRYVPPKPDYGAVQGQQPTSGRAVASSPPAPQRREEVPVPSKAVNPEDVLTPEEIKELATLKPSPAPMYYVSAFGVQGGGNDFQILCQRSHVLESETAVSPHFARMDTVAILTLSPQGLKDLSLLLPAHVAEYEKRFGEIRTVYSERLKAAQK